MARSTAPKEKAPPPWATDPTTRLVACIDGPLRDQWFLQKDWDERVDAARYMTERSERRSPVLDYVEDGVVPHPEWSALAQGAAMYFRQKGGRS